MTWSWSSYVQTPNLLECLVSQIFSPIRLKSKTWHVPHDGERVCSNNCQIIGFQNLNKHLNEIKVAIIVPIWPGQCKSNTTWLGHTVHIHWYRRLIILRLTFIQNFGLHVIFLLVTRQTSVTELWGEVHSKLLGGFIDHCSHWQAHRCYVPVIPTISIEKCFTKVWSLPSCRKSPLNSKV